jgi:hypothetical protein
MRRAFETVLVLLPLVSGACGYALVSGAGRFPAGAERVLVRPFDNMTGEAEIGVWVAAGLREELGRRGLAGGDSAPARIEGEVTSSSSGVSTPTGATYQETLAVKARLLVGSKVVSEQAVSRSEQYLGGADPLETEGRRRVALRKLSLEIARDLVESFQVP